MNQGCLCQSCNEFYSIDLIIPNEIWEKITSKKDGSGLLCPGCISKKLKELNIFGVTHLNQPTCGVEQRKFLNIIEHKADYDSFFCMLAIGEDHDSILFSSDLYFLNVRENKKDYIDLQKVIRGE